MLLANAEQIRSTDQTMIESLDFPGLLLMETAGRKTAEFIFREYPSNKEFLVLAGPGNNGGDGFVIARYLHLVGHTVSLLLSQYPEKYQGDALSNLQALKGSKVPMAIWPEQPPFTETSVLVDALLGTGIQSELRGSVAEIIAAFRSHPGEVVAVDLPSGLDANTGFVLNQPLSAAHTLTFQLPKLCHAVSPASNFCGVTTVVDLGMWPQVVADLNLNRHWIDGVLARPALQNRPQDGHKGTFGHAALVGGSRPYVGAVALSAHAALHVGAGLSTAFAPEISREAVLGLGPEVMLQGQSGDCLHAELAASAIELLKGKAVGIGPGMGQANETASFLEAVLKAAEQPMVLDADAINMIAAQPQLMDLVPKGSIFTPHPGEMRRLSGNPEVTERRLEVAEAWARKTEMVLVLKGAGTIVCDGDQTWVNSTGNSGMGTAGSGDVLTGVIVGLLAQGYPPSTAAWLGVFIHGLAGDCAALTESQPGVTATSILSNLGPAIQLTLEQNAPKFQTI